MAIKLRFVYVPFYYGALGAFKTKEAAIRAYCRADKSKRAKDNAEQLIEKMRVYCR